MAANVAAELDSDDDNSSGSSVGMPTLEDQEDAPPPAQPAAAAGGGSEGGAKQNRAEKKNRKAMQKLGMKSVPDVVRVCVEINQCVGCTRQFFTKSFLGDDAAVLARSSGEEPASPRHRAGVASMARRTTRRFSTNAP